MLNVTAAAQAIEDAYSTEADRLDRQVSDREMLAAALRALVGANAYEVTGDGWYSLVIDVDDIYAIADELEAQ